MVKDSLTAVDTKKIFAEAEEKYQNKEKKQLINIQNEQLVFAKKQKWWLISGLLLSGLVAVLLYAIYRNKKQSANILDQKNRELDILNKKLNESNLTKTKLFGIISHDLRSPVSQLFTFLKLQQKNDILVSEEERDQHRQKLITSSKNLLETMEDLLLWSKSQMENFELDIDSVDLAQLFGDTILLMQNQADAKEIKLITEIKGISALSSDQNLLLIILRNLVQNAINHAFNQTTIYLKAGLNQNNQIYMAVINQGEVIPADQIQALIDNRQVKSKSSGYGLLIVKELALKINATFNISSNAENGTEITLVF
jgi:signal transduction histidine kinase